MTTQIGKLTKLIPYPSSLPNYNYNIIVRYHILIVLQIRAVRSVIVKHITEDTATYPSKTVTK